LNALRLTGVDRERGEAGEADEEGAGAAGGLVAATGELEGGEWVGADWVGAAGAGGGGGGGGWGGGDGVGGAQGADGLDEGGDHGGEVVRRDEAGSEGGDSFDGGEELHDVGAGEVEREVVEGEAEVCRDRGERAVGIGEEFDELGLGDWGRCGVVGRG